MNPFGLKAPFALAALVAAANPAPRPADFAWLELHDGLGHDIATPHEQEPMRGSFKLVERETSLPLPMSELRPSREQWIHLYVFDAGLGSITHLHPRAFSEEPEAPAAFEFTHTFARTGLHYFWAVYEFRDGTPHQSPTTLRIEGESPAPEIPTALPSVFYAEDAGSTVRLIVSRGVSHASARAQVLGLEFGRSDGTATPLLDNAEGAAAQIMISSLDGRGFWTTEARWAPAAGPDHAAFTLPAGMKEGDYRVWVQWQDAGATRTGRLAVRLVRRPSPSPDPAEAPLDVVIERASGG